MAVKVEEQALADAIAAASPNSSATAAGEIFPATASPTSPREARHGKPLRILCAALLAAAWGRRAGRPAGLCA